jgi:hypothetical protein
MEDIFRKRELVKQAYPTQTWRTKVSKMPDSQIVAIFLRLRSQGRI